jgi:hypothetical protein
MGTHLDFMQISRVHDIINIQDTPRVSFRL